MRPPGRSDTVAPHQRHRRSRHSAPESKGRRGLTDIGENAMHLASRAFEDGSRIPNRFTCDGDNEMPPLEWTGVPPEARSLALVCSDPDAPSGTFHHWAVYDIPPDVRHLPECMRAGMRDAVND